jgi:4-hydroxyphenylpyruvate dioxygenase-like putative hemolysin
MRHEWRHTFADSYPLPDDAAAQGDEPESSMTTDTAREALADSSNPLGIEGTEYAEYATAKPQALDQVLEQRGFKPIARHRSREVLLYRQVA